MLWLLGTAALVAALCLTADFLRRPRSASLALHRQLVVYFIQRIIDVLGAYHGRRMERDTRRFMQVQHELTAAILRSGARTRYGRDHGLAEMHSLAEFRRRHPVTEYPHYVSYIQAVERGEEDAMLGDDEVYLFAASSGTTGSSKHLPVGKRQLRRVMQNAAPLVAASQGEFGGGGAIGRTLVVTSRMKPVMSASGKRICSLSPVLQQESPLSRLLSVTPPCVDEVDTEYAACYLGLLFALRDEELHAVFTSFIFVFLRLMGVLEEQWPRLVEEIAVGRVGEHLELPEPLLRRVNEHLTPEPGRAAELKAIFSLGFERVLPRVWPKLRFVQAARSGLAGDMYLAQAVRYLGDVPILDMAYCSSEAWLGISDGPAAEETSFTLTADACLYEFLPVAAEGGKLTPNGINRNHLANESGVRRRVQASTTSTASSTTSATSASSTGGHDKPENLPPHGPSVDAPDTTITSETTSKPLDSEPQSSNSDTQTLESRLLLADQVHVGGDYEMVVTTRSGLYRYRQGDVVRVTRFHNQAPVVQLRYRTGTDLLIEDTHVSGLALYEALRHAASRWSGRTLLEFGTAESLLDPASEGQTPHHLMFVELAGPPLSGAEAGLLDECLRARSEGYALKRSQGAIGAIRVLQMAPNVFLKLRDKMATRGQAHWTQLKRLHILRRPEDVEFLMGHVLPPTG